MMAAETVPARSPYTTPVFDPVLDGGDIGEEDTTGGSKFGGVIKHTIEG